MSKIYFFRHAQASFMAKDYDKLSPHGEKQSAELGKYLVEKNIQFDKIFVGPLKRQKKTFEIVAEVYSKNNLKIPEAVIIEGLKEHKGTEAMHTAFPELKKSDPYVQKLFAEIKTNPKLKRRNNLLAFQYFMNGYVEGRIDVPNIETWADFRADVKNGLKTVLENTGKGETISVFTSGGTISSIVAESLFIKDEKRVAAMNFSIRNTSFSIFLYSKNQFNILSLNELPHLKEDMITFV